jgi:hypothetical protein
MEGLSKKLASNDRILENINNRMDNLSSAIKNQHSFNKMIEPQIAQLVATVPPTDKCKILGNRKILKLQILSIVTMQLTTTWNHQREGG